MDPLTDVVLVNVPAGLGKKPFDLAFPFIKRLNYGLLSLASTLRRHGYGVAVFDPQASPGRNVERWLTRFLRAHAPRVVGISCISGFSYPESLHLAAVVRKTLPGALIVIGGKDHVGQLGARPLAECAALDMVVRGEAEETLLRIVRGEPLGTVPNLVFRTACGMVEETALDLRTGAAPHHPLDYHSQPHYPLFPPSVEVSRGCSFGCEFCVSARTGVRRFDPATVVAETVELAGLYGDPDLRVYFETPMFLMPGHEIAALAGERERAGATFTWRTETRVDYLDPDRLRRLFAAGLRVVDLGFESGCPEILTRMGKTRTPDTYLKRAREILETAHELGVIVKLNVLFYIGETRETVQQTLAFLEDALPWVECVSAYPLLLYPGSSLDGVIGDQLAEHGGSLVDSPEWNARLLWPVNPSGEFTYAELNELGVRFARAFQTMETFYRQKLYGYISPGVGYPAFAAAAEAYGLERLPFSRDATAAAEVRRDLWRHLRRGTRARASA